MKTLKQLSEFLKQTHSETDTALADLQLDSRQLKKGDVFIALQGLNNHGLDYLKQAIDSGVSCAIADRVLNETEQAWLEQAKLKPVLMLVENLADQLAELANWFYEQPSNKIKVVGITGTNGKTSTAHYLAQLLLQLGQTPALIGTLGNGVVKSLDNMTLQTALNTTPDVVSVHRLLHQFSQQGANWVVMEVSSHALELGRVEGVEFTSVALTQVTRDHLDFHGTEQAYQDAKAKLFLDYQSQSQVLNIDDDLGSQLAISGELANMVSYSVDGKESALLRCVQNILTTDGIRSDLEFKTQTGQACLNLMGRFNIENVLCALGIILANGFKFNELMELLPKLTSVKGRMQKVSSQPTVIVDFAHTADALQQVLQALKDHLSALQENRIWVVFGCGGDRDQGKRPLMAKVAESLANYVVLTSDNPRFESPQKIMDETLLGFNQPGLVKVIEDRELAIEFALSQASKNDVVLVAGKGHENYQEINGQKLPFSDEQVVLNWVNRE
ncbi:MAG: UDP-N-acetylmuramoyl-L-alanyl-D-glutamate--2,6-diaminopimelate ligase [Pseudomonadota bacterium]|nr:UDP-N-acetylmuramoyl-L-alanyl-D-glutamate--2,6-diaminopimelate ligase [Pseudomonadota bacterium]